MHLHTFRQGVHNPRRQGQLLPLKPAVTAMFAGSSAATARTRCMRIQSKMPGAASRDGPETRSHSCREDARGRWNWSGPPPMPRMREAMRSG